MKSLMTRCLATALVLAPLAVALSPAMAQEKQPTAPSVKKPAAKPAAEQPAAGPLVQMAILLDTSNSMDGLIDQARSQLWKIVNEFAKARRDGQPPRLEVALYEYGNDTLKPETGWVRLVLPLTDDLDAVSEALFALKTNGGQEYCGTVIQDATQKLKWSEEDTAYKVIFIAGNEPFTQGEVDPEAACTAAIAKGIMVNTIHCGNEQQGISGGWKRGAELADGKFMTINQDEKVVHIPAPQDDKIAALNEKLNTTYVPYGTSGEEAARRQVAQDALAEKAGQGSGVQRALAKASSNYRNARWDLVDYYIDNEGKLPELKPEQLPEDLRKLSPEELKAHLAKKVAERKELQQQIGALNAARVEFVEKKKQEMAAELGEQANTLDAVIIGTVREQAAGKEFKFEE